MKYTRNQFKKEYYGLWELGLLLPNPNPSRLFSVKYKKNEFDEYSRVTLRAVSINDALERACYAITYASRWRPEDIDLHAVYDEEENLLWVDEPFYNTIQKENEFRGMERREFLALFGATSAAILFGFKPMRAMAGTTTTGLSGTASSFNIVGEQLYTTPGSYSWTVPAGVSSVSVVCVGAGAGSGGGGGALGYKNNISVTPGNSISVVVGAGGSNSGTAGVAGGNGGSSSFSTLSAQGGFSSGTTRAAPAGHDGGGSGGVQAGGSGGYNGGGAAGYSGNGGDAYGGQGPAGHTHDGAPGTGGGGSGGAWAYNAGGGVGLFGEGTSGGWSTGVGIGGSAGSGSFYGGAGYGWNGSTGVVGSSGAVRIIWGSGRSFPSNAT